MEEEKIFLAKKMLQICIIAKDCERINENWAKLLGKEMAGLSRYEGPENTGMTEYQGKMIDGLAMETNTFDLASDGKSIQFEIMAALNGPSEWYRFMQERKQGIHHVAFAFTKDEFEEGLKSLKNNAGMEIIQKGHPYATPDASYAYLKSKEEIGTTLEILGFGKYGAQAEEYRKITAMLEGIDDENAPLAGAFPRNITLITDDIETAVRRFAALFDTKIPTVRQEILETVYKGNLGKSEIRKAVMETETAAVVFLQPVKGKNAWTDFADEWGTGIFSIAFEQESLDELPCRWETYGVEPIQEGVYPDGTKYLLMDGTEDYACVFEFQTSEEIERKLREKKNKARHFYDVSKKYNPRTPLKDLVEDETAKMVLERHFPGMFDHVSDQMAIAYRMPLMMIVKMADKAMPDEKIYKILDEMNAEADC